VAPGRYSINVQVTRRLRGPCGSVKKIPNSGLGGSNEQIYLQVVRRRSACHHVRKSSDFLQTLVRLVFGVWVVAMTGLGALLLSKHAIALPAPAKEDPALEAAVQGLPETGTGSWSVLHVLYAKCRCSERIVDHLVSSTRPSHVHERVLLVADDGAFGERLRAAGFTVVPATADELRDRYNVEAAPLFVVSAPDGALRYAGGYTREKQGADIRDLAIIDELLSDGVPDALPTVGCAVSEELRAVLNPLGIN
jgi:hypothetical protein